MHGKSIHGDIILYHDQDETLWDTGIDQQGRIFSTTGLEGVSQRFQIYTWRQAIAYWHTIKADSSEKMAKHPGLFDLLRQVDRSPVVGYEPNLCAFKSQRANRSDRRT
jgi:RNA polymerase sigma-70 factor (ECF subfamily)